MPHDGRQAIAIMETSGLRKELICIPYDEAADV